MLDTRAIARQPTDPEPTLADAIKDAVREAAGHRDRVTHEGLPAELAALDGRLARRLGGTMPAQTMAIVGAGVAILRLLGT